MVYEYTNDFNISSSMGFNISNSSKPGSKKPTWNISTTGSTDSAGPSAPPYPGSEEEFDALKGNNTNGNSYNFFFIDSQGQAPPPQVVEKHPYWKGNPAYEKQLKKSDLIDGAISLGIFIIFICAGIFMTHRFNKRAKAEKKRMFNEF